MTKLDKKVQKVQDKKLKKKQHKDSDSESTSESEEDFDMKNYRKFLAKKYPSKYMNKKVKENSDSNSEDDEEWSTETEEDEEEERPKKKSTKSSKKSSSTKKVVKKSSRRRKVQSDNESSNESDEDYESEEPSEESEDSPKKNYNIILTIGDDEDWDDEDDEDYVDSQEETENEDESVSSVESTDEDDSFDENDYESCDENESQDSKHNKKKTIKSNDIPESDKIKLMDSLKDDDFFTQLKEKQDKNKNDKTIQKCLDTYLEERYKENKKIHKKEKKQKDKNMRIFKRIISDKNTLNDFFFYEKLPIEEQKKIIKELREINKVTRIEKPYRMTLLESNIPIQFKAAAMKKINSLKYMEPGSGEYYKIKNWVDTFMKIPFTSYQDLPINISDGVEKCHDFMESAQKILDSAVYGLNDAKMQIMQMLGQLITNPKAIGTAIAIHGPPGTGKTSLVKEGISKILNRPFAFIALGGATDSSFLEGHGYTYEGSTWGRIVQILVESKCMNPVIYFDELDKISETPRGEEIAGILTHLTDTSQNTQFHDKYFAEINFDLSKCLFIFSYNDESRVNPILRDRMYRIKTKGYSPKDKTIISNSYLLPKIREQVKFNHGDIIIPDSVVNHIIETHCQNEDGVRNLKRCLEIIHTKLNLYRLMRPNTNLFENEMSLKVEFPFTVTKDIVDKLIKKDKDNYSALHSMYV